MRKYNITKKIALAIVALMAGGMAQGQSAPTPTTMWDCGEYMWPLTPSACPEVIIKQKGNHHWEKAGAHTTQRLYRQRGWDTVVDCQNRQIVLSCTPNIPVQRFNGTYYVDPIPYDPPDPTFHQGTRMPISTDDNFAPNRTNIPFPFYFFGYRKDKFLMGANGLVTFSASATDGGISCPWSYSASIPWPDGTSGAPSSTALMRDAIYGIYEDTYPSPSTHGSTGDPNWGIYYGVQDAYPCRKIICTWNDVPQYSCTSLRCTYQIVCYEGSNIIEVHVNQRQVCSSWNGGNGVLGIQNATGVAQVADGSNYNILAAANGKPAAFYPQGYNRTNSNHANVAFRFTPAGLTTKQYGWYRIFDDGRPDAQLRDAEIYPDAVNDSNGYMMPMHDAAQYEDYPCKSLTQAYVSPKRPTRYRFFMQFMNANGDWYQLADTIFVGVDTLDYLNLHKLEVKDTFPSKLNICIDDTAKMRVDMNKLQQISHEEWRVFRISNGDTITLDSIIGNGYPELQNNFLRVANYRMVEAFRVVGNDTIVLDTMLHSIKDFDVVGDTVKVRAVSLYSTLLPTTGLRENKIDTIIMQVSADYESGCHSYDTMMVRIFPKFDTIIREGICRGETYTWDTNGRAYKKFTDDTDPSTTLVHLRSTPGCDSTVHLALKVYDVSYTVDHVEDCKPITWLNGKTYTTGNAATASKDTIVLKNRYDCDSVIQLDFVIHPLTAKLRSDVDHFTIDNLNAVLTDISIGGNGRVWKFPNGGEQTGATAYYTIPVEYDGAEILLVEHSQYGCVDSAKIYIPLNKEYFWVPNAFTPDNPAGNNKFGSVSKKTLRQEMQIYNRRGEMVFRCEGADCQWDGKDLNGNPCIQGAYVYIIRYTNEFEPNETKVLKGTVMLIR